MLRSSNRMAPGLLSPEDVLEMAEYLGVNAEAEPGLLYTRIRPSRMCVTS